VRRNTVGTSGGGTTVTKVIPQIAAGNYGDVEPRKYGTVIEIVNPNSTTITISGNLYNENGTSSTLVGTTNLTSVLPTFTGSFNNLPLAASDINLPTELALGQTVLSLLLPQQLGSLFNDTVLDPNTGIIAGFLNARDDLATAVLTANNDFPTELGSVATAEWANMSELVQSTGSTLLAELGTLLNPADLFAA